jgi:4-hydroxythreonine-4-phosphate dehydrogenase
MNSEAVIVVAGEPHSIFLEIFFKSLKRNKYKKPLILIASKNLLVQQMKKLNFNYKVKLIKSADIQTRVLNNNCINLIDIEYKFTHSFQKISIKSNKYIATCFKIALKIISKNKNFSLINGPINKKYFLNGNSLGITEYLAKKTGTSKDVAMLIFNKNLAVAPITTHLALKDVAKNISKQKIHCYVDLISNFYKAKFKKKPRIAITGLNPHCESNFKNCEEKLIILPIIRKLRLKKFNINGPFPADTIFMKEHLKDYDVIIGMYHDQVLTPMKALFGFDAINITLGLPFLRVSPDHGPNETMAGKNISNPNSLIQALKFLDK